MALRAAVRRRAIQAIPAFSSTKKAMDTPSSGAISGQKKRWFKFPLHMKT
jgi:hypothetical protein